MSLLNYKWLSRLKDLLREGLSPQQIALSVAIGAVIGIIPILGIATFTITGLAIYLRLNLPITFFITYAVTPLQWLLFIPFIQLGEVIFYIDHSLLSYTALVEAFDLGAIYLLREFFWELLYGITAWLLLAFPLGYLLYLGTRILLVRLKIGTN